MQSQPQIVTEDMEESKGGVVDVSDQWSKLGADIRSHLWLD